MRIELDQQRELYQKHASEASLRLIEVLSVRRDELIALGRDRAFETVGVHEYGDSTYWLDPQKLDDETLAELADAIFYMQIQIAREHGDLPQ